MEVEFVFAQVKCVLAEVCTEIARARQEERPSHLPGEGSPPRTCEDEEGAAPEAAHPSPAGTRAMPPLRGTQLLRQHSDQHLDKREMEKIMHATFPYWISQELRKKGDVRALSNAACKTHRAPGMEHPLHPWTIWRGFPAHLDLGTDSSESPPPQVCLNVMLCHDKITITRAAAAVAIPGTENNGDG